MAKFKGVDPKNSHATAFEREVRKRYLGPLIKYIITNSAGITGDVPFAVLINIVEDLIKSWIIKQPGNLLLDMGIRWATQVDRYHERSFIADFFRVASVDVRPMLANKPMNDILRKSIEDSVELIKTIPPRFGEKLDKLAIRHEYITGETRLPQDLADREKMLKQWYTTTGKDAGYNLRRVVRDQSNKLTGRLTRARQQAVGVEQYEWKTAGDDRVRQTHVENDKKIFQWGHPPADTGAPGEDIQCRCVAIPHITIEQIKSRVGQP